MGIFGDPQDQVDLDHLKDRVARLEAAVAVLQQQAASAVPYGAPAPPAAPGATLDPATGEPAWMVQVRVLVAQDDKIDAIKLYRENTGLGLKEAKDAVERL